MSEPKHSWKFWLGVFFLLVNFPFGIACGAGAVVPMAKDIWHGQWPHMSRELWIALAGYGLSWLMLGAGVLLAGPAGKAYVRKLWLRYRPWGRKEAEEPKA